jgi:hypothetical protein
MPRGINGTNFQEFNGNRYYQGGKNRYFWRKITCYLAVWERAYGPVPRGMEIHHKDGDPSNDAAYNLELVTPQQHLDLQREEQKRGYGRDWWQRKANQRRKISISLHVAVWEHHHGPRPAGFQVHHKDDNPANNTIDNLELVSRSDHARHHALKRIAAGTLKPPTVKALAAAAEWHRTDAGRAWASRNSRNIWEKHNSKSDLLCTICGGSYAGYAHFRRKGYCSPACSQRAHRRRKKAALHQ